MRFLALTAFVALACSQAGAQSGTYPVRLMTPESALKAARAALEDCRKRGFQVSVAVVDRAGVARLGARKAVPRVGARFAARLPRGEGRR
jgi:hypothetical protein